MGSVQALKMNQTKHFHEFIWRPSDDNLNDLRWTLYPEEACVSQEEAEDIERPPLPDLDRVINFRVNYDLFDKIQSLSSVMGLSASELIRRLLDFEVHQYGPFQKVGKKSG